MIKLPAMLVSAAVLAGGVAACGSSSSTKPSSTKPSSTKPSSTKPSGNASAPASTAPATASTPAPTSAPSNDLTIASNPSGALMFSKTSLAAKAGTVTIHFTNTAPEAHNFTVVQGTNGAIVGHTPTFMGATKTLKLTLKPGTYTFFCSVPGHRSSGMQGTLAVS